MKLNYIFRNSRHELKRICLDLAYHWRLPLEEWAGIANTDLTCIPDIEIETLLARVRFLQNELYTMRRSKLPRIKCDLYESESKLCQ